MTEINDQYRVKEIQKYLDVYEAEKKNGGMKKNLEVEYRGQKKILPVINIDPKVLLLNHANHRLTSQLEDHPRRRVVYDTPTTSAAQEILSELLRQTDAFGTLKEELKELGQQEPGLITREGLLVNGNTRVVALRELGKNGVDVAVLPGDVDAAAILELEIGLQMVHLTRQDYSFTNELLLLDKCRAMGDSVEKIAQKMKWIRGGKKKVEKKFQLLRLINEIRRMKSPPIVYKVFDLKSQHLIDLNDTYEGMKHADPAEAENLKWSRVAAIFLNLNKDQTRAVREGFIDEHVSDVLEDENKVSGLELLNSLKRVTPDDGLDEILDDLGQPLELVDPKGLVQVILDERIDENGQIKDDDLSKGLEDLHNQFWEATEGIISSQKRQNRGKAPTKKLRDVREDLDEVVTSFKEVCNESEFNPTSFEYELKKAKKALEDLTKMFQNFRSKN